jgi:hypothetical protein
MSIAVREHKNSKCRTDGEFLKFPQTVVFGPSEQKRILNDE